MLLPKEIEEQVTYIKSETIFVYSEAEFQNEFGCSFDEFNSKIWITDFKYKFNNQFGTGQKSLTGSLNYIKNSNITITICYSYEYFEYLKDYQYSLKCFIHDPKFIKRLLNDKILFAL